MNSRLRPSADEMQKLIKLPHFGESRQLLPSDPVVPMPMLVEVARIECYDGNPRLERNPLYSEIKESIRARGLDRPLVITRRPGAEKYMCQAGGNTALTILQELYVATKEERFARVQCKFIPWVSEADTLVAHLVENDKRGGLSLIERADAVRRLREMLEKQAGETLSQRRLAEELKRLGYGLNQPVISRLEYAANLQPVLRQCLRAGMGEPQLRAIRNLETAAQQLWTRYRLGDEEQFSAVFDAILSRHDKPGEWHLEKVIRAVEMELAERTESDLHTVSQVLQVMLSGDELPETKTSDSPSPATDEVAIHSGSERMSFLTTTGENHQDSDSRCSTPKAADDTNIGCTRGVDDKVGNFPEWKSNTDSPAIEIQPAEISRAGPEKDLYSLWKSAYDAAYRIAGRNRMQDLVQRTEDNCGYILIDFPDSSLQTAEPDNWGRICALWWQLAAFCELMIDPERSLRRLPEHSRLRSVLADPGCARLSQHAAPLECGQIGLLLWRHAPVEDAHDLLKLAETYWQIHADAVAVKLFKERQGHE